MRQRQVSSTDRGHTWCDGSRLLHQGFPSGVVRKSTRGRPARIPSPHAASRAAAAAVRSDRKLLRAKMGRGQGLWQSKISGRAP